jgi:CHAD domain-containing protein
MADPGKENELAAEAKAAAQYPAENIGLASWMERVKVELGRVQQNFDPDAVHDLRVALRRCLAIADIHMAMDPLAAWAEMRKESRRLFKRLGDLRDTQVMGEWIKQLADSQDPAGIALAAHLGGREAQLRIRAQKALGRFNLKKWEGWKSRLSERSTAVSLEEPVFRQFALERWQAAYELHRQALRNRSGISYHRLRIGLKRLRYTVENLLPQLHEAWGKDLKRFQDVLGELHDLSVTWRAALQIGALADRDLRSQWRVRMEEATRARIQIYREKAVGRDSLWPVWRAGLPTGAELKQGAEARIRLWASFRDPDFAHTLDVADVAMQLFDGLEREQVIVTAGKPDVRTALRLAAVMHNVGATAGGKRSGKAAEKLISGTEFPLGLAAETYRLAALAVRYQRGSIPPTDSRHMAHLDEEQRFAVQLAAAVLSLAKTFVGRNAVKIRHVVVSRGTEAVIIFAAGYLEEDALARKLAAARFPLELACRAPIMIRPLPE